MSRWRNLPAAILVATLAAACGRPGGEGGGPNLVVITVDTLRADHLHAYGYFRETSPAIDRLAREALLFENAYAPMATTLPSHTSLMTSTYPARHGVLSNFRFFQVPVTTSEELQTAAQMLRRAGYSTAAFTSSSPLSEASGINAGFETFRGPPPYEAQDRRIDIPAEVTIGRALAWLEQAAPPFFLWVHLFDPHDPYRPPPPYDAAFADEPALRELLRARPMLPQDRELAVRVVNLYDGEILYTDAQIGRLFDRLRQRGLYGSSVIVFAADHGEGLLQHGVAHHGEVWNEQIRVPLIIRFPDGGSGRETKLASLIDVLPTVAGAAGLPLDTRGFDGIDLLRETRAVALSQREVREGLWATENYALTNREWRYVYFADRPDWLFHLAEDPLETRSVLALHPSVARRMRHELGRLVAENKKRMPLRVLDEVPEEVRRQLEALGYLE